MIDINAIKDLTADESILRFATFVIAETGNRHFPDYRKMDLMKIPNLVSNIWVYDYGNDPDEGLIYHFSGTQIDEYFGRNVTGLAFQQVYTGTQEEQLVSRVHARVRHEGKVGFTKRHDVFQFGSVEKPRKIESLSFPCSSDDQTPNFGIGITYFTFGAEAFEPVYIVL